MTPAASGEDGASFSRKKIVRAASGFASLGILAGFAIVGASPAVATSATDCTGANTVVANSGGTNSSAIQTLLTASAPTICLSGTFTLTAGLILHAPVSIYGLTNALLDGGGTYQILSSPFSSPFNVTVENLTVSNGYTPSGEGGAIYGYAVTAINSHFLSNAGPNGGAIFGYTVIITGSTFEDNVALYAGGAVAGADSVSSTSSTFTGNTVQDGYGGALASYGVLNVFATTFESNSSTFGGGAAVSFDTVDIENSTFVSNVMTSTGGQGGALDVTNGLVLQNTFYNNSVPPATGGQSIYRLNFNNNPLSLRGNIFAADSTAGAQQLGADSNVPLVDLGGNIFSTPQATEVDLPTLATNTKFEILGSALFSTGALAANGGPTQTLALSATSPAIDNVPVGSPSVTADQRGVARTALSDAGAYEVAAAAPAPALAATGALPNGLLAGGAAALLSAGALLLGVRRRLLRTR